MPLIKEGYANNHTDEIKLWKKVKSGFTHFAEKDIGVAKITPCFENKKSVVFNGLKNGFGAGTTELHIIRIVYDTINPEYVLWNIKTDAFISNGVNAFSGAVGQKRIGKDFIENSLIPIPPRNEQNRIIDSISITFAYIDAIDSSKEEFKFDLQAIKEKILDLAIRGKLVPQNPEDEPASLLLERIRAQKEELIKQGKIKRDKKESVIFKGEDNSYYENLPKNWSICTLGDISEIITGGTPSKSNKDYYNGSFPFFKPADLEQGVNTIIPSEYLSDEGKNVSRVIPAQSTLICCIGTIGKSGFVRCECATNQQINAVIPHIEPKYIYYFCNSQFFINELQRNATATTVAIINKSKTAETPFLLPPIAEQKRIVAAIEITFAQLDEIAKSIS